MNGGGDFLNNALPLKVGRNLYKIRKEKKLSQLAVQMNTGIEQALLSKYETGKRIPPTETLVILADFYGTSVDYLLDRTENRTPYSPL